MAADDPRPEIRRGRSVERAALSAGPARDLRDAIYHLYAQADTPRLEDLARTIAAADDLPGAPGKDRIRKIIAGEGLGAQQDIVTVAVALAREAGHTDTAAVAEQVQQLWLAAKTAPPPRLGRPVSQCDPLMLGVRPAIQVPGRLATLPPYLPRPHDTQLRQAADQAMGGVSTMVTLVGGSSTGKTRACWELAQYLDQREPGRWWVWNPYDPTHPEAAAQALAEVGPNTLVWLNEAQHYLMPTDTGPGERIAAGLRSLLHDPARGPVLVLTTLWPEYWSTLTTRPSTGQPDPYAQARDLLTGTAVTVPDAFTPAELSGLAGARVDPRLRLAVAHAEAGRITQYLAGAGELENRYRTALPEWVVPGFAGENVDGDELLGVDRDALALAVLIGSRSARPPLALGVHGPWGSGKTFFMNVLARHLHRLATAGVEDDAFCGRIVPVWFNAWHYAEGNLWASLLHHIFLSLHPQPNAPQRQLDAALAKVTGVQETTGQVAADAKAARDGVDQARQELALLRGEQQQARVAAARVQRRDVWESVVIDEETQRELNAAAAAFGIPAAQRSARELVRAAGEVRAAIGRGRQLATAGPWWRSPLAVGLAAAAVVAIGGWVAAMTVDWSQTWLAPAVTLSGQLTAAAAGATAWLLRQAALVRKLLAPAERVQQQVDARLAELEAEHARQAAEAEQRLAEAEAAVDTAKRRLADAEARQSAAEVEYAQLTGARLLSRYLSERVSRNEYGEYLGMVALAHRDLRDLDDYLRAAADDGDSPVDRIVLYIDDLDRCQPETVVRVLEAVNLLLALPLFVVVVGVDDALLTRALRSRHPVLLGDGAGRPQDYLDKIFQLSYRLPLMTPDSSAALLRHTARSTRPVPRPQSPGTGTAPADPPDSGAGQSIAEPAAVLPDAPQSGGERFPVSMALPVAALLELSDAELQAMDAVAPLVGTSPRRAKRFLNVYRVAKARVMIDPTLGHRLASDDPQVAAGLLILVALAVGRPDAAPRLLDTAAAHGESALGDWLRGHADELGHAVIEERLKTFEGLPMRALTDWIDAVRPFAWPG